MNDLIFQLLQGMIRSSEENFHRIQGIVQSLLPDDHLLHALRNLQHSELLRLNMLHSVLTELAEPPS